MSVLLMVHAALSPTEPRTASEVCYALPLTLSTVEATLRDLVIYGGARREEDAAGVVRWLRVSP